MKYVLRAAAVLIGLLSIPGAIAFGVWISAALLTALVVALWKDKRRIAALLLIVTPPALVVEYTRRIPEISARYEAGGAQALTTRDRVAIFALNLEMAIIGAALGFREAAFETTLMAMRQRTPVDGDGAFLLECPKIRRVIKSAIADPRTAITLPAPRWRYDRKTESLRVGLAVNGAKRMMIRWNDDGVGDVTLPIRVTYPPRYKLVIAHDVFGQPLYIDEGLFHALEELGWLTSYEMRWHASIASDDPRLQEPTAVALH